VFERETARADRRGTPLCIAVLDLDDFKSSTTPTATSPATPLKHLVKIVKDTLRSMDVIARFGGEEFLILMPETTVEAAASTMTRLQRELTKHFFLHDNEKVLITFSAGVALRRPTKSRPNWSSAPTRPCTRPSRPAKTAWWPTKAFPPPIPHVPGPRLFFARNKYFSPKVSFLASFRRSCEANFSPAAKIFRLFLPKLSSGNPLPE
jgi:diguanylate cyclase (GGDEF)-like protein